MKIRNIFLIIIVFLANFTFAADSNEPARTPRRTRTSRVLKKLSLPEPKTQGDYSLEEMIAARRSVRDLSDKSLTIEMIAQLIWAGQGITDEQNKFRAAPSAGASYPFEIYVIIRGGIYTYDPNSSSLTKIFTGDIRDKLSRAGLDQPVLKNAPCSILLAGNVNNLAQYAAKAQRFMYIEAGHIAQNILLQATSMGLGSVPIGAFNQARVKQLCKLKPTQQPIYILCIGYPTEPLSLEKPQEFSSITAAVSGKRAVLILPERRFNDRETFDTLDALSIAGIKVDIAGEELDLQRGGDRGRLETTMLISQIDVDLYDAFIFVSGGAVQRLTKNRLLSDIVFEASSQNKVLAAIGQATRLLAMPDIINGYVVTGDTGAASALRGAGAIYTGASAERDQNIVTAQGYRSTTQFAKLIVEAIAGYESVDSGTTGRYVPSNIRRRRQQYDPNAIDNRY